MTWIRLQYRTFSEPLGRAFTARIRLIPNK